MAKKKDNSHGDFPLEDVSLESILAEYKGSAYISGDKKTPTELLNEQTERILKEALGDSEPNAVFSSVAAAITGDARPGAPEAAIEDSYLPEEPGEDESWPFELIGDDPLPETPDEEYAPAEAYYDTSPDMQDDAGFELREGYREIRETAPEITLIAEPYTMDARAYNQGAGPDDPDMSTFGPGDPDDTDMSTFGPGDPDDQDMRTFGPGSPDDPDMRTFGPGGPDDQDMRPDVSEPDAGQEDGEKDSVVMFFDNYRAPEPEAHDTLIHDVAKAVERELGYSEGPGELERKGFSIFGRSPDGEEEQFEYEDSIYDEPELKDAVKRFAEEHSSISIRSIPAAIVTMVMVTLTLASEAGMVLPFGIGRSLTSAVGALMIMLLVVMMLCVDLIVRGAVDIVRGAPNVETLILFSCAFSFISGAFTLLRGAAEILPYCAVSAVSLTFAAFGERFNLRAITETLKTAAASSEPYGVQAEYNSEINKSILKKAYNRTDGFYSNLMHPDISETAYRYASPVLLVAALVLSIMTVLIKGQGEYFLHILSALLAAAAPFSAMLAFSIPFGTIVKSVRKSGAAIAGWGGADDICYTDGTCVTDDDLFPPGTLSFNGVKIYDKVEPERTIRYTASLIIASGSGLSRIFSEVLKTQKIEAIRIEDFACYEGGIGAVIHGDSVMTGSAAFMNLLGLRVPDDMNIKNAVFTAINNKLIAMFAVEYLPVSSVQSALISMLKWRIKLFFAMRDFNITPLMLEKKFRVPLEDIEYIQAKDSYTISDSYSGREGRMSAILTREGLGPFAEAITGGRLLKASAQFATVVSVVTAVIGVLFMFFMCWNGSFLSAKPGTLLLFMLATLAVVLVVCGYVKCKK